MYNTDITIALKNNAAQYCKEQLSLFRIQDISLLFEVVNFKQNKKRCILLKIKCPICGELHQFNYMLNDLIKREVIIGGCEITGSPIFFIGKEWKIDKIINKYNEIREKMSIQL